MLATSVRVSPCSALCAASSDGRVTTTCSASCDTSMADGSLRVSSPRGPLTVMPFPSWRVTVTPLGRATGCLPIRDIWALLPDESEELAARARLTRITVGHQPLRRGEDRDAQSVAHARHLGHADVLAQPGRGHTLERTDHRLAARGILEPHAEHLRAILGLDRRVILDEIVVLQDARDLGLHSRYRHVDAAVLRSAGVADARQHVGNRIGHAHEGFLLLSYPEGRGGSECVLNCGRPTDLPACLAYPRNHPQQCELTEADSAEAEPPHESARTSAPAAPIVLPHGELRLPLALLDHGLPSHRSLSFLK